jgi:hypothetical protein
VPFVELTDARKHGELMVSQSKVDGPRGIASGMRPSDLVGLDVTGLAMANECQRLVRRIATFVQR